MLPPYKPNDASQCWLINSAVTHLITRFDTASYFYEADTSETHLLSAFHDEIIQFLIENKCASTQEIAQHIAELCDQSPSDEWREKTHIALNALSNLSLVTLQASQ